MSTAKERAAEALRAATGVTYPWALDVTPKMLAAALDIEELIETLAAHRLDPRQTEWLPRRVCRCGWVGKFEDHETHVGVAVIRSIVEDS